MARRIAEAPGAGEVVAHEGSPRGQLLYALELREALTGRPDRLGWMARHPEGEVAGAPTPPATVADETLLDLLAELTPEERLRWNDRMATTVLELRNGFAAAELDHAARPPGRERS